MMRYSMSFPDFNIKKRIEALKEIGLTIEFNASDNTVDVKSAGGVDALGGAHKEAVKFICDPVYNPVMYNMEPFIGTVVNRLHYEFWCWKFKQIYFDFEEEIAIGIMNYIENLDCKEQDVWLALTPEALREAVITATKNIFNDDFWAEQTLGQYVVSNLSFPLLHDSDLSWKRIHQLIM
jgi:hypothetical protein